MDMGAIPKHCGKLTAQAVVSKSGRASLKEVFVDGKPYAEAMKAQGW